jgi:hypothetical protein
LVGLAGGTEHRAQHAGRPDQPAQGSGLSIGALIQRVVFTHEQLVVSIGEQIGDEADRALHCHEVVFRNPRQIVGRRWN